MLPCNRAAFCLLIWTINQTTDLLTLADQVLSRVVNTKYGRVQGAIRHHGTPSLPPIEVFLGVPYASPPTGDGRFTPTSSPLPWDSVKRCVDLPPVCPQPLPDAGYPGGSLPPDRVAYLRSLRPVLQRQSEDCLYLNIYTPHDGKYKQNIFGVEVSLLSTLVQFELLYCNTNMILWRLSYRRFKNILFCSIVFFVVYLFI